MTPRTMFRGWQLGGDSEDLVVDFHANVLEFDARQIGRNGDVAPVSTPDIDTLRLGYADDWSAEEAVEPVPGAIQLVPRIVSGRHRDTSYDWLLLQSL
jgi:hypothetical protein